MSTGGDASQWAPQFCDDLVPKIINLILDAWSSFVKPRRHEGEVQITARFREHLRPLRQQRGLPFTIWPESLEAHPVTGKQIGRIDLRFLHGYLEEVYFAFECKRLSVPHSLGIRSLANEYVVKGMMRFITGQYAKDLDKGGMLAYVMDGNVRGAITAVGRAISGKKVALKMTAKASLSRSSIMPRNDNVRLTKHGICPAGFQMHHVFLAV